MNQANEPSLFDLPPAERGQLAAAAHSNTPHRLEPWLQRRLEAMGLMDPDTGATRRARSRLCEQCRRPIMRGIDADWGGRSVDCDPTPVSQLGETLALIDGRRTYELRYLGTGTGAQRYEIDHRTPERIRGNPPGTKRLDVLIEHNHDGKQYPNTPSELKDNTPAVDYDGPIPY
jgi:hypothetical protein